MCVHGVLVTFPAHFIQFDFLFTVRKLRKKHATHILSLFTVTDAVVAAERLFVAVAITFVVVTVTIFLHYLVYQMNFVLITIEDMCSVVEVN